MNEALREPQETPPETPQAPSKSLLAQYAENVSTARQALSEAKQAEARAAQAVPNARGIRASLAKTKDPSEAERLALELQSVEVEAARAGVGYRAAKETREGAEPPPPDLPPWCSSRFSPWKTESLGS